MPENKSPLAELVEEIIERGELPRDKQQEVNRLAAACGEQRQQDIEALKQLTEKVGRGEIKVA